jgi:hypothetical protein
MRLSPSVSLDGGGGYINEPVLAVIDITPELAERIRALAHVVTDLNVYKIEELNYAPEWYSDFEETDDEPVPGAPVQVDCVTLNVTNEEYWWEAYLPDTQITCRTDTLTIADLPSARD